MELRYLYFEDLERDSRYFRKTLSYFEDNKVLIINLIQGSRKLEIGFEIENYIIYNTYDLIDNIANFDKVVYEIDPNLYILPSSFKAREDVINVENIINSIPEDEDYEFDYIFVILDKYINLKDNVSKIVFTSDANLLNAVKLPNKLVAIDSSVSRNMQNLMGVITDKDTDEDLNTFANNLKTDELTDLNSQTLLNKIKRIFKMWYYG